MNLSGRRVVVLGLGISGEAAARHLLAMGAHVVATDSADDAGVRERVSSLDGAELHLGTDGADQVAGADLVIASPGVRPSAPAVAAARSERIPVWSEVELAFRIGNTPIVGITGTNGKTTTTQMTVAALTSAGYRAAAAGNIGRPLVDAVVEDRQVVVAELSSFQLHAIDRFRTPIGVLLNIDRDHLDWHDGFDGYANAKTRLFENQRPGDVAIHLDDPPCARAAAHGAGRRVPFSSRGIPPHGAGVDEGWIVVPEGRVVELARLRRSRGPDLGNAVAAAAAACAFGADPALAGIGLAAFEPAPHRMELVATIAGIDYVNDSKATNPHATLAALDGVERAVLIAGGRNKGLDLGALAAAAPGVGAVVAFGESAGEVLAAFAGVPAARVSSMDEAVERAASFARPGDTVLLSPACASFDLFTDYKARGEAFRAAVKRLAGRGGDEA